MKNRQNIYEFICIPHSIITEIVTEFRNMFDTNLAKIIIVLKKNRGKTIVPTGTCVVKWA